MRGVDWQMVLFVGTSLVQEYWLYWGLPRVYFWDVQREFMKSPEFSNQEDEHNRAA
ncbi:hypothetical protein [Virgibacillus senegalensis]|uniref:hypothetical protein n=1 Tax=Virgibacillus senegalensis TaxID=1499679 RepID=UPI000A8E8B96|nr:hypothetical protein [Virgibacillus senegalensis]